LLMNIKDRYLTIEKWEQQGLGALLQSAHPSMVAALANNLEPLATQIARNLLRLNSVCVGWAVAKKQL
jgi:hypothetical protein